MFEILSLLSSKTVRLSISIRLYLAYDEIAAFLCSILPHILHLAGFLSYQMTAKWMRTRKKKRIESKNK